ncbi:GGDEF domain-containing protein [Glaciecola sp. MH2013]|uniref:GGDEF domain-containing protein n=1 Tax=Glaciecola sp. MH2013 TaxID=2785524 RepID=UPI0018A08481|nr:GGDEF domain-containing protein [Glaciecola sp. MH2013]MBF7072526.1 GGDEF domain-containing protein [Glaciecola sp. MH2013]
MSGKFGVNKPSQLVYEAKLDEFIAQSTLNIKRWSFTGALAFYLAFTYIDYHRFSVDVHQITIPIRVIFGVLPLLCVSLLFWTKRVTSTRQYLNLCLFTYFSCGMVHIFVFAFARNYDQNLSELGFVILILFGCLMTALPIKPAATITLLMIIIMAVVYPNLGWEANKLAFQLFVYVGIASMCLFINRNLSRQLVNNYHMINELYGHSITDRLTNLKNSRYFEKQLLSLIDRARNEFKKVSLIIIDVDNFKELNDRNGHDYGDKCLVNLAGVLSKQCTKECDFACRIAGDEFGIVLYDAKEGEVETISQRILTEIQLIHVEVSMGIATSSIDEGETTIETKEQLFKNADRALYLAKDKGRNTFVVDA